MCVCVCVCVCVVCVCVLCVCVCVCVWLSDELILSLQMIHCQVCCQSFHLFCAGVKRQNDYTCPSCITCRVCGHGNEVSGSSTQLVISDSVVVLCCSVWCVWCVGGWFHERCASDHHSTRLKGTWRCVTCTKCLSCKTTTPGKVRGQSFYYILYVYRAVVSTTGEREYLVRGLHLLQSLPLSKGQR